MSNYELLQGMCMMTQEGLLESMNKYLSILYGEENIIATPQYVIAKGTIPIALVAHLDTVHKKTPSVIYHDKEKNVMWSPEGIGADDRAGVYAIHEILNQCGEDKPTVIYTTDEEIGAVGAEAIARELPEAPVELKYIIELDRRGEKDCVFYDHDDIDFESFIEEFDFVTSWGSFSDICSICPVWGVAGVNLSIGYEREHTLTETLNITWMENTISKVGKMLASAEEAPFFKYTPSKTAFGAGIHNTYYADDWNAYAYGYQHDKWFEENTRKYVKTDEELGVCFNCLKDYNKDELFIIGNGQYCIECSTFVKSCDTCKEDFFSIDNKVTTCFKCRSAEKAKKTSKYVKEINDKIRGKKIRVF